MASSEEETSNHYGVLAVAYAEACSKKKRSIHSLLFKQLHSASTTFNKDIPLSLVCKGNEAESFLHRLTDEDLLLLLQVLQQQEAQLLLLNLSYHALTEAAGEQLAAYSNVIKPLQVLLLQGNNINPKGAQQLCKTLSCCCTDLQTLDLSHNKLGREGGTAAAELLKQTNKLKTLNLKDCDIDIQAFVHITTALQQHNKVRKP